MRIENIHIRDFKRFHDLSVTSIPATAKLVLLTGPNGSGKTSLFEAFNFWMSFARGQHNFEAEYHVRAVPGSMVDANSLLQKNQIKFHGTDDVRNDSDRKRKAFYIRSAYRHEADFTTNGLGNADDILNDARRPQRLIHQEQRVSENYQRMVAETVMALYSEDPINQQKKVSELADELIGEVREAMGRVFGDLMLQGPGNPMNSGTFRFKKGSATGFHYKNLSGGEKAAFDLLLDFVVKRRAFDDTVYCIDEPELHMHTRLQSKLLEVMFDLVPDNCQLWLSTHSIGMARKAAELNAANPGQVAFIDFHDQDFDQPVILQPILPDRRFWGLMFHTALDDLAELVVPKHVVFCEGNNEEVLAAARAEIVRSWRETCELNRGYVKSHPQAAELFDSDKLPGFHDPFAGGGALPLEAQRLGLESYASDLNPVAVTINKAMIEIPPRFAGRAPVGPRPADERQSKLHEDWSGAKGLAEDVRRYGAWMRDEAQKRIGHLYPKIEITPEMAVDRSDLKPLVGQKLTVIAWLWARTVKSPNPAFSHAEVPLASTFVLSSKAGKEAYVQPVVEGDGYRFTVKVGAPPEGAAGGTTAGKRAAFICLLSKSPIDYNHIRNEGKAGRMGQRLMAIVAEGARGRVYLEPTVEHIAIAAGAKPVWSPEMELPNNPRDFKTPNYGLTKFGDLFTSRQLVALTTFSDLVAEAIERCRQDALAAWGRADNLQKNRDNAALSADDLPLDQLGAGATAYAQAVGMYLAFAVDRCADFSNSCTRWVAGNQKVMNLYGKQAIAMTWDYPEAAILNDVVGGFRPAADFIADCILKLPVRAAVGFSAQQDAAASDTAARKVVSTDPPYYDNIGYADLSDFFYVWLRKSLKPIFPGLYATLAVPKAEELVATPYRHGGKQEAEAFFLDGMTRAMHNLAEQAHPAFPVTIYYAFKQSETSDATGTTSTGWETFLDAVLQAGFAITGTWPMRSEQSERLIGKGTNALASSIVLVCRKRLSDAPTVSRREFLRELNAVLPEALDEMTRGGVNSPVAPVDLSQAIIGPGMAIFSQYAAVLEADGTPMRIKTALQLINRFLAEDDFDHDTQFCLHWFEGCGWASGKYGEADVLARAKGTSVGGLQDAGVVESGGGKLRLLRWAELPTDWSPETDTRTPVWDALHQLIRALNQQGESAAGALLARMPARAEPMRALAYRLYTLCERKGWAEEARAYNELVTAWSSIEQAAGDAGVVGSQGALDI